VVGTAGYSGSPAKWIDIDIESIQGYTGYQGYGEIQIQAGYRYRCEMQAGHPQNTRQGGFLLLQH